MALKTGLNITTLFSPEDDTQTAFLQFVQSTKSHLRIAIYGMHLPPLVNDLLALRAAGKDIALVCDHTQAMGRYEHPEIDALIAAGVPLVIGSSDKHMIMHHKFAVRDKEVVLSGSWNFSVSASKEDNFFDIVESPERSALFLSKWQEMHDWIASHEQKWQENHVQAETEVKAKEATAT